MNIKAYFEKHNDGTLLDSEWEQVAQILIRAKFEEEKKARWAKKLEEEGIHRIATHQPALRSSQIRKWMAAASVLLIMAAAGWYFFLRSPLSPAQKMASQYLAQPFRLYDSSTRSDVSVELNRGKALEAFEQQQYEKSIGYLQLIEATGQAKAADYFQMGLCLMYQKKPDYQRAVLAFKSAQERDPGAYIDEINWFSGLCYLMLNNNNAAAQSLQKVVDSSSSRNRDAATELLRHLMR